MGGIFSQNVSLELRMDIFPPFTKGRVGRVGGLIR